MVITAILYIAENRWEVSGEMTVVIKQIGVLVWPRRGVDIVMLFVCVDVKIQCTNFTRTFSHVQFSQSSYRFV